MRWIVRSVFALVLAAALIIGALVLIPSDRIAGLAVGKFNALTGRELVIEGGVRPSIWPVLGVKTGAVSISNADWSDAGPMFKAEGLEIAVDLAALLGGEVKITAVTAHAPMIMLERAKDGRENWVFGGDSGGTVNPDTPGVGKPFTLGKGLISKGTLVFIDHKSGARSELSAIEAEVAIPDYEGEAQVQMRAVRGGQDFALNLTLGAFRAFLDGDVVPMDLGLTAGAARVAFKGRAGWNPMAAEGDLDADLAALRELAALAGTAAPDLPVGLGAGGVSVQGGITLTDAGSVHLRGGTVRLDETVLATDADLVPGDVRPMLSAKIVVRALDLRGLIGGQGNGTEVAGAGWSKDAIDVSALATMDASVAITADAVDLGLAKLGAVQVMLTVDRARAVFDIRRIVAYDGTVAGQFVVNGRKGLSVGGDLGFAGMALQPLLHDLAGYERLLGTGDLRLKFLGSGNSVDAIMQGLEGSGSLALGRGELHGLDIAGMLRTLDTGFVGEGQKTIFDSVAGSFVINEGVLTNDDLAMVSPYVTLKGAGKVGLGARDLTYRLRATAMAEADGTGGLTAPLLIKGPWANPKFSLDLEALADEQLAEEKAALEAKAREKAAALEAEARAKLESELGIVQQEGESLEDAARRRGEEVLTDEAAKALEKLLGGGN
jgi:AsmA protein